MKHYIKSIAIELSNQHGLINLFRFDLCTRAGISEGSFSSIMGCTFTEFVQTLKNENVGTGNHVVNKRRANPELRKQQILDTALNLAIETNYNKLTKQSIAESAGVSVSLVAHYFTTMPQLKRAVIRAAISQKILIIIAQGLANNNPYARKAPKELKMLAAQLIANY